MTGWSGPGPRVQKPGGTSAGGGTAGPLPCRAVTGRACTSQSVPPAMAHSMSCGVPKCAATRSVSATTSRTCAGVSTPPAPDRSSTTSPRAAHSSPATWPAISRSPSPATALTTRSPVSPVTGLTLKAAPAASAATIRWTSTPIGPPAR